MVASSGVFGIVLAATVAALLLVAVVVILLAVLLQRRRKVRSPPTSDCPSARRPKGDAPLNQECAHIEPSGRYVTYLTDGGHLCCRDQFDVSAATPSDDDADDDFGAVQRNEWLRTFGSASSPPPTLPTQGRWSRKAASSASSSPSSSSSPSPSPRGKSAAAANVDPRVAELRRRMAAQRR